MKHLLRSLPLLLGLAVSIPVYAQRQAPTVSIVAPPADTADPFGQRLQWTTEQIIASVQEENFFHYEHHQKTPDEENGSLLVFSAPNGMRLMYFLRSGRAEHGTLYAPTSDGIAEEFKNTYFAPNQERIKQIAPHWYLTPYAKVFVKLNEATEKHPEALVFVFMSPLFK